MTDHWKSTPVARPALEVMPRLGSVHSGRRSLAARNVLGAAVFRILGRVHSGVQASDLYLHKIEEFLQEATRIVTKRYGRILHPDRTGSARGYSRTGLVEPTRPDLFSEVTGVKVDTKWY